MLRLGEVQLFQQGERTPYDAFNKLFAWWSITFFKYSQVLSFFYIQAVVVTTISIFYEVSLVDEQLINVVEIQMR